MLSRARLLGILWTPARHAPVLLGCSRHELEVDDHPLLQGIFPTRRWYPGLPHCSWILFRSEPPGSPQVLLNTDKMPREPNLRRSALVSSRLRSVRLVAARFISGHFGPARLRPSQPQTEASPTPRPSHAQTQGGDPTPLPSRPRRRPVYVPPLTRPAAGECPTLRPSLRL